MNPEDLRDELGLYEPIDPEELRRVRRELDRILARLAFDRWHARHQDLPHEDEETAPDEAA